MFTSIVRTHDRKKSKLTERQPHRLPIMFYISFINRRLANEGLVNFAGDAGCNFGSPITSVRCYPLLYGPLVLASIDTCMHVQIYIQTCVHSCTQTTAIINLPDQKMVQETKPQVRITRPMQIHRVRYHVSSYTCGTQECKSQ